MGRMIVETLLHATLLNQFRTNWGLKKGREARIKAGKYKTEFAQV
jgi:hypothetical protein